MSSARVSAVLLFIISTCVVVEGSLNDIDPMKLILWKSDQKAQEQARVKRDVTSEDRKQQQGTVTDVRRKCVVFMHVTKSGGNTLKNVFKNSPWFGKGSYRTGNRGTCYSVAWRHDRCVGMRGGLFIGDSVLGSDWVLAQPNCTWVAMMRHPVTRLVSAYTHCRRRSVHYTVQPYLDQLCAPHQYDWFNLDILDFAKVWGNNLFRQLLLSDFRDSRSMRMAEGRSICPVKGARCESWLQQSILLEGLEELTSPESEARLERAIRDLKTQFNLIGLLEHYDESLELFQRALPGADLLNTLKKKVKISTHGSGKTKDEATLLLERVWNDPGIMDLMRADLIIYEECVKYFNHLKEVYGMTESFDKDVPEVKQ